MRFLFWGLATIEQAQKADENSSKNVRLDDNKRSSQANEFEVFGSLNEIFEGGNFSNRGTRCFVPWGFPFPVSV